MQQGRGVGTVGIVLAILVLASSEACKDLSAQAQEGPVKEGETMSATFILETEKSIEEAVLGIEEACKRHKFGVLGKHDIRAKMEEKGVELGTECLVVEICNPHLAKQALDQAMEVSAVLPCRVSVYRSGGKTLLATIPPSKCLELFGKEGLGPVAAQADEAVLAIVREAAGSGS